MVFIGKTSKNYFDHELSVVVIIISQNTLFSNRQAVDFYVFYSTDSWYYKSNCDPSLPRWGRQYITLV